MGSYLASGNKKIHLTTINCTPQSSSTCKLLNKDLLSFPIVDKWGDRLTSKGHIVCCLLEVDSLKITVHYLQWYHIFSAIWIVLFPNWQFGIESLLAILDWSFCQNSESEYLCIHSLQTWSLLLWHSIYGSSEHHIYLMLRLTLLTVGGRGIDIIQRQGLTKLQTLTFNLAMRVRCDLTQNLPSLQWISSWLPKASPIITYGLFKKIGPLTSTWHNWLGANWCPTQLCPCFQAINNYVMGTIGFL
jgi:hypothetical protein